MRFSCLVEPIVELPVNYPMKGPLTGFSLVAGGGWGSSRHDCVPS